MRSRAIAAAALGILLVSTGMSAAGAGEYGAGQRTSWTNLRLQGVGIAPLGQNRIEIWNECGGWFDWLDFRTTVDVATTGGVTGSFEYVFKHRYGIEAALSWWYDVIEIDYRAGDFSISGSPNFILPTLGANYHFYSDGRKDFYAGGFFSLGVIVTGVGFDIDVSSDVALGLNFGMDYAIADTWTLGFTVKYIDFGTLNFSLLPPGMRGIVCDNGAFGVGNLNFISATAGIGYRF